ncbi:CybS-domain-containing protein [Usnea florida]
MAPLVRPSLLSQFCIAPAARQVLRRQSLQTYTSSELNVYSFRAPFKASGALTLRSHTARDVGPNMLRVAGFHTSGRRPILPAGPQVIDGTANDPAPVPHPSPTHGSYHWAFERLISAALIPLTVAPFAAGTLNPIMDAILCATIVIHSHIGFQSCIIDYIPSKRLPRTRAFFWWGLRAATLTVAVGLYEFETNDVGLTEAVKRTWTA